MAKYTEYTSKPVYQIETTDNRKISVTSGIITMLASDEKKKEKKIQLVCLEDENFIHFAVLPILLVLNLYIRKASDIDMLNEDIKKLSGPDIQNGVDFETDTAFVYSSGEAHISQDTSFEDSLIFYQTFYTLAVEIYGIEYVYDQLESSGVPREFIFPANLEKMMVHSSTTDDYLHRRIMAVNIVKELYAGLAILEVTDTTAPLLELGELLELGTYGIKDHQVQFYRHYYIDRKSRQILPCNKKVLWDKVYPVEQIRNLVRETKNDKK